MDHVRTSRRVVPFVALVLAVAVLAATPAGADDEPEVALPTGFTDSLVHELSAPTAIAFTPDGRVLITQQHGVLRIADGDTLRSTPALNLQSVLCSNSERGLLGVAVDPKFASNHFVYLYYTFKNGTDCPFNAASPPVNRVSRFVLGDDDIIDPASEMVLLGGIPSFGGNHNGGDVHFGKDGYLYVSVGDGGCDYAGGGCGGSNDAARERHTLLGKILRITRSGAIPPTNPFLGADSARCRFRSAAPGKICQETFAWGLRNPFRFAMDPNAGGTTFHINDVGQGSWEEIDLGTAGADYGWNVREGHCAQGSTTNCGPPPAGMTNPIYDYSHAGDCDAITGGAFIPNGLWPAKFSGDYLFADLTCGKIFRIQPDGIGGFSRTTFAVAGRPVAMAFGPSFSPGPAQALYYLDYDSGGEVRRITRA